MRVEPLDPPRRFTAGSVEIAHTGDAWLEPDEQVTFRATSGSQLDVVRKPWGYYATSSLNGRLAEHGLSARLVEGFGGRLYLLLVERDGEEGYARYLEDQGMRELARLDTDGAAAEAVRRLSAA